MPDSEIIPDWLWLAFAAAVIVFVVLVVHHNKRKSVSKARRRAAATRHIAHLKAWRWVYGQPRMKRISYRKPDEPGAD